MRTMADSVRAESLNAAISAVRARITKSATASSMPEPRLVAVSKLKPASDIQALYDTGYRHFGENYVQEMVEKAEILPKDIAWHFIGSLQSNKCATLAAISNLFAVETLDSEKKAKRLNEARSQLPVLNVFIQVNTSQEESKSGISPEGALPLARYIVNSCPNLKLMGLMTIGSIARSRASSEGEHNQDFTTLVETRAAIEAALGVHGLELSMGMSSDFEDAISQGSTNVRVGSQIFGARPPKNSA
ncbi:hypothetical protein V1512DRAFT_267420 [Lipomyces arxii]|uniref:uncharacterized protein n=1 Tax=Lipomyces arxii TaxID=56418 RepID=UPI0034CE3F23